MRIAWGFKGAFYVSTFSNYSYQHVLGESNLNASLVLVESYCVVFDIMIEDVDNVEFVDRPWGNNPKTVVAEFLTTD